MDVLTSAFASIASMEAHYLVKAKKSGLPYYEEFLQAAKFMHQALTRDEFENWVQEKMLIKTKAFDEKTFIQYAVETSAVRYFGEKFPTNFQVEACINQTNNKNVDCRFEDEGYSFNIEVKCSDFKSKEKIDARTGIKFGTIGRIPERQETIDKLVHLFQSTPLHTEELKEHHEMKNMDNNLKDFLILANEKFHPSSPDNELNILVVGCGDAYDIQNWFYYLWAERGLFTKESFTDKSYYENVDMVILSNLYFKHNRFYEKQLSESWTMSNSFNLVFPNPLRKSDKRKAFFHFLNIFDHYSFQLEKYEVPGDSPAYVKNTQRISYFIKEYLEKEKAIYLFELPPKL